MSSSFSCWCSWTKWGHWVNLRLYLFVFGVSQRSLLSVCGWFSQWWLPFVLLEVDATLYDGCEIWEHLRSFWEMNLFRVVLRLYGCVYKILRLTKVKVAYSVVVVSVDYHSRIFQLVPRRRAVFDTRFTKLVLRSNGSIKFVMLFQDSDTGGLSSITTRIKYLFDLQF